jgi:hypothetical protein
MDVKGASKSTTAQMVAAMNVWIAKLQADDRERADAKLQAAEGDGRR